MIKKALLKKIFFSTVAMLSIITISNCSSSDDNNDPPSNSANCIQNGTETTIEMNHNHTLSVTVTDINAGTPKTYDIQGGATHSHTVTLSAANFSTLASNTTVTKSSSFDDGHDHQVFIACAGN